MSNGGVEVDFVPVTLLKTLENVVRGDGDSQRSSEDERPVIEFVDDHMGPGEKFFVVHD